MSPNVLRLTATIMRPLLTTFPSKNISAKVEILVMIYLANPLINLSWKSPNVNQLPRSTCSTTISPKVQKARRTFAENPETSQERRYKNKIDAPIFQIQWSPVFIRKQKKLS